MGYLFLGIALLCGTVKGYCGKRSTGTQTYASDALLINSVRMIFCVLIGLLMLLFGAGLGSLHVERAVLLIALLSGVSTAIFVVTWLLSVRQGAYMMVDVFLLMGVILPLLLCRFLYDEPIKLTQYIGMALLILAGYIMCTYNTTLKGRMSPLALLFLVLCAVSYGLSDFSAKMFVKAAPGAEIAVFNFYTYLFAGAVLVLCYPLFRLVEGRGGAADTIAAQTGEGRALSTRLRRAVLPIIGYVFVMAICLFLYSYFKTAAARYLDAVLLYPLSQGASLVLSMLMAALLFHERINRRAVVGVALCFAAMLLINLL